MLGDQKLYPERKEVWHKEKDSCTYRELYVTVSVLSIQSNELEMASDVYLKHLGKVLKVLSREGL